MLEIMSLHIRLGKISVVRKQDAYNKEMKKVQIVEVLLRQRLELLKINLKRKTT
jgi:hypothetical protein